MYPGRVSIVLENPVTQGFESSVLEAAEVVRAEWAAVAAQFSDTGHYANSIQVTHLHRFGMSSWVAQIKALAPYSLVLDYGREAFNLASKIDWGGTPGVRHSKKDGTPYIIVPLRHGAFDADVAEGKSGSNTARRQMMPETVYKLAKQLERTYFSGGKRTYVHYKNPKEGREFNVETQSFTEPRNYKWGGRLRTEEVAGTKFESMYKFGPKGNTHYGTFRTITPNSVWMIPAFSGHRIAEQAMLTAAEKVAQVVGEAAQMRIAVHVQEALGA